MRKCQVLDLGSCDYASALAIQRRFVERRKLNLVSDSLILVEHPHTITMGRNGRIENLLAGDRALRAAGIAFHHADRGGDITYHGPGQIVGYPILDLGEWKRDVRAYVRAIEQVMIDTLADFGIAAERLGGCIGVWVNAKKIGAIGVHISRWVTSHGFALNVNTGMSYFQYIVPCGLAKPVTSMAESGSPAHPAEVSARLVFHFGRIFERAMEEPVFQERAS